MDAKRGGYRATVSLGVLSLIPRVYAALAWSGKPVWDGHYYDSGARRIAQGLGYSSDIMVEGTTTWNPWCHYPVGYSGFLAGLYSVFGESQHVAPLANAALGALIVMLTHRIGLHWLSPRRAWIAALLCAVNLELVFYSPLVMTEILGTALPLLALWIGLVWRNSWPGIGVAGGVLGLATLVQPQSILLAPLLGAIVVVGRLWSLRRALGAVLATTAALLVVTPWTLRNCYIMDGCAFVSTNGGWNLAIGAFPRATGQFETLRPSDGCARMNGQVEEDRCWASLGTEWIRKDVGRWIGLAPAKLSSCFDHASFPVQYLAMADPDSWPEPQRWRWMVWLSNMHRVLLCAAAFGFVAWRTRDARGFPHGFVVETAIRATLAGLIAYGCIAHGPTFWPLALGIVLTGLVVRPSAPLVGPVGLWIAGTFALFIATHVVFFGQDRYHVRLIPLMCLLAAAVGRSAWQRSGRQQASELGINRVGTVNRPIALAGNTESCER